MLDSMSEAMVTAINQKITTGRKQLDILRTSPSLQSPDMYITQRRKSFELLRNRLLVLGQQSIARHRHRFLTNTAKLDAMSPLKVLTRGYAMAQTEDGAVLRSVQQLHDRDTVKVVIADGSFNATVSDIKENN